MAVFLVLFKDREGRVGPTFHFLVYDVYQENEDAGWFQDFLAWPTGKEDSP